MYIYVVYSLSWNNRFVSIAGGGLILNVLAGCHQQEPMESGIKQ